MKECLEYMNYSRQSDRFVHAHGKVSEIVDMVVSALNVAEPEVSTINLVNRIAADLSHVLVGGKAESGHANHTEGASGA